jgi:UDP-2,3-diacylglucosamine hydrolase
MKHTLFISDLHLDESHKLSTEIFLNFLDSQATHAQAVYILGDFFEAWLGDDDRSAFIDLIRGSLKQLHAHGVKIYIQRGNRDFLLGRRFAKQTGAILLPEYKRIELYGKKVLLTHGDALCTQDERHMRFRKFSQNKILQLLLLSLPLNTRKKIARSLRYESKVQTKKLMSEIMDVVQSEVINVMQKYDADYLIHGHTHRPSAFHFTVGQRLRQRVVLGSWEHQGCVLKWSENGKQELIFFN